MECLLKGPLCSFLFTSLPGFVEQKKRVFFVNKKQTNSERSSGFPLVSFWCFFFFGFVYRYDRIRRCGRGWGGPRSGRVAVRSASCTSGRRCRRPAPAPAPAAATASTTPTSRRRRRRSRAATGPARRRTAASASGTRATPSTAAVVGRWRTEKKSQKKKKNLIWCPSVAMATTTLLGTRGLEIPSRSRFPARPLAAIRSRPEGWTPDLRPDWSVGSNPSALLFPFVFLFFFFPDRFFCRRCRCRCCCCCSNLGGTNDRKKKKMKMKKKKMMMK